MNTSEAQEAIFEALTARGYTDGLNAEQLTARQVCKMLEEACETATHVKGFSWQTRNAIAVLSDLARADFDDLERWQTYGGIQSHAGLRKELPDVGVTLANAAEALAWAADDQFDVMRAAVEKATADVERGVR